MRRHISSGMTVFIAALIGLAWGGAAAAADKTPPGDPPGNNGTIKVVASEPSDPDPGNEPQIDGCVVWLEFYGFDAGETADIAFHVQPPTGDGELLTHREVISEDPAGGGQDKDDTLSFNLASALAAFEPHPEQGYHVKVTSDSQGAPGGPKQKVFWLNCAPAPVGALRITKTVEGDGNGPFAFTLGCNHAPLDRDFTLNDGESLMVDQVPGGTVCALTETDTRGAGQTRISETPSDGNAEGVVRVAEGTTAIELTNVFPGTQVAGASATRDGAATPTEVAGAGAGALAAGSTPDALGDVLPRTGTTPWAAIAAGSLAVVAGTLSRQAARRIGCVRR